MVGQKTATLVVLLNLFSLSTAWGDAFYDALKASGKYDSTSTAAARKSTIDADRTAKMNALTDSNPNFVPLSKSLPKTFSDDDVKKWKAAEENEPETADTEADQDTEAKLKKDMAKEASANASPTPAGKAPAVPVTPPPKGKAAMGAPPKSESVSKLKVINDDPDDVSFVPEVTPPAKLDDLKSANPSAKTK